MSERQNDFPCAQCGALLQFEPGTDHLKCSYCGHSNQIAPTQENIYEYDFRKTLESLPGASETEVSLTVKCESCAAEFNFDENIHSDECPFCGTRIVVETHEHRHIQPKAMLPFRITAEQASDQYRSWLKRLWFAPNKLKKYARKDSQLNGMYLPYWTYDADTRTRYQGERGTIYRVPVKVQAVVNGRRVTQTRYVTKIRWTPVSGRVSRRFDDVLIFASQSIPRPLARELSPWDLENLTSYREEYLSGFRSEVYQVDLKDGFDMARERMHVVVRSDVAHDIGGDHQRIHQMDTQYGRISFKHVLLPFWTAGFRFRRKSYQFVINGRTGEVQGQRPYSFWKITFAILGVAILMMMLLGVFAGGQMQTSGYPNPLNNWPTLNSPQWN